MDLTRKIIEFLESRLFIRQLQSKHLNVVGDRDDIRSEQRRVRVHVLRLLLYGRPGREYDHMRAAQVPH